MLSHPLIKPWNGAFYNPLIQFTFWNLISRPQQISYIAVIVSDQDIFIAKSRCFLREHLLLYSFLYRFLYFVVWDSFVWIQSFYVSFRLSAGFPRVLHIFRVPGAILRVCPVQQFCRHARDFYGIADSEGLSKTSVHRAKEKFGLRTVKGEKGWIWTY